MSSWNLPHTPALPPPFSSQLRLSPEHSTALTMSMVPLWCMDHTPRLFPRSPLPNIATLTCTTCDNLSMCWPWPGHGAAVLRLKCTTFYVDHLGSCRLSINKSSHITEHWHIWMFAGSIWFLSNTQRIIMTKMHFLWGHGCIACYSGAWTKCISIYNYYNY